MPSPQECLIGLLEYIEQVEKLKKTAPLSVPTEFFRAFQADMQGLPGVEFNQVSGGDDVWVRILRLKEEPPPEPIAALRAWVTLPKSPERNPELRSEIFVKGDDGIEKHWKLVDFPAVKKNFERYVSTQWSPWAAKERPRRKTTALYNKLFAVQQSIEANGGEAPLEAIWGMGMAVWKRQGSPGIEYPLLTQACDFSLDTETFAIEIRPRDVDAVLELDCYADIGVEGVGRTEAFWRQYRETAKSRPTPFEPDTTEPVLKAAVGYLDPAGEFVASRPGREGELPSPKETLQVTPAWVIFVRRRSGHLFLQDIDRLKKKLLELEALPSALAAFVTEGSKEVVARESYAYRGLSSSATGTGVRELYFPMPYNAEQVAIVEKLEGGDGVVVQGPPGTGKTHTIANVICHFLAHGGRVLVTSRGEEALRVLQEKLPEEIRSLSVALLTDEHSGMKQFERSIQEIASQVSGLQPSRAAADIEAYEKRLGDLHEKIAALDRAIDELARRQLERVRHAEREVSPEELARMVLEGEREHGWLMDALDPSEHAEPRFSGEDVGALREARRRVGEDLRYLVCDLPAAESLPAAEVILTLHQDLCRTRQIDEQVAEGAILPLIDATPSTFQKATALADTLKKGETLAREIAAQARPWTSKVRALYLNPKGDLPVQLHSICAQILRLETARRAHLNHPVEAPPDIEIDAEVSEAIERLCEGKSAFALPFGKKSAREHLAQISVSGLKPEGEEAWQRVRAELAHRIEVRKVLAIWNALASEFGLEVFKTPDAAACRRLAEDADHIELIHRLANGIDRTARPLIEEVFGASIGRQLPADPDAARSRLLEDLLKHLAKGRLGYAMAQVDDLTQKLDDKSGEIVQSIREFIGKWLGSTSVREDELTAKWRGFLAELRRLAGLRSDLVAVERVAEAIEYSGARHWAKRLRSEPASGETDSLLPANYLEAWRWRVAKSLLESLEGHRELKSRFERRKTAEEDLARTYRALVAARAWLAVCEKSPESVRQALQEYLNEIQAIGKGQGIRAIHHRQLARAAMERACPAVPCWIMPQWRVAESIPPEIGAFDLVIIDEASQSDIWALPSLLRGKKVLVVGDHRQVSPSGVGLEEQKIVDLFNRFLAGLPHASQMRPDRSIYDLARVVFAGNSVMLKEHFRCVPAIIEFSKREFYEHEIRPLRIPKRSERLDPPLIDVFVKGGYRRAKVNEPEARAIVSEIEAIIADPTMAGRSIGVVTLLGNEQAKLIDEFVRRRIPANEIIARRIRIGEPPVFQGRESDIMLVSMVLTKGDRGLSDMSIHQQRLNVAASRARDRMILFRSIEESDVSPQSLTARFIAHFRQPFHQDAQKVEALRQLCESDFEREMFDELTARGYRVRPQVKVGGYRIDFVIEGTEDRRLAVECDGDRYHGPSQWADDMTRQRVLERAGWTFWRCFASSFVLRRREVLEDLLGTLKKMGIDPIGSESVDTTAWSASRIIEPADAELDEELDSISERRFAQA